MEMRRRVISGREGKGRGGKTGCTTRGGEVAVEVGAEVEVAGGVGAEIEDVGEGYGM